MEEIVSRFVANPHALAKDGVITEVVFMQDYDEKQIKAELKNHDYDEVVRWEDAGYEVYVGYKKHDDFYAPEKPFESWVFDFDLGIWVTPIPLPKSKQALFWNEDLQTWDSCCPPNPDE
jgi:hypothetical protein